MSELDEYERFCESTDVAKDPIRQWTYPQDMYYALGLGGEVSEAVGKTLDGLGLALGLVKAEGKVLETVKKCHRDGVLDVRQIELELGDVMWYLSRLANYHGLTLRGIIAANIEKLSSRRDRGVLHGNGDNR